MNIIAVEPIGIGKVKEEEIKKEFSCLGHSFLMYYDRKEDEKTLIERMKDADIVIISNIPLTKNVLNECKHLKMLAVAFTGIDHIDQEFCKEKNIEIINASGYATEGVSELAIGLMIDVLRHISVLNEDIRQGKTRNNYLGFELRNKTVGIVGTGAIGTRTALLLQNFGCKILAYSRTKKQDLIDEGISYVDLKTLMKESDIVSVHTPLTEQTFHLINKEMLDLCKPSAIVINTARGNVIDNSYLTTMLNEGRLLGAGIDVFEKEPPLATNHPLLTAKNCIVVPHIAYATRESFDDRIEIVINNIKNYLKR